MNKRGIIVIAFATFFWNAFSAQAIFNLTPQELKIDSIPPCFTHIQDLKGDFFDSIYTVTIEDPKYLDMTKEETKKYKAITNIVPSETPDIMSYVTTTRKKGVLNIAFIPIVAQKGKYKKLKSFKLNIKATPKTIRKITTITSEQENNTSANRYASNSILATGTWAKIRVSSTGIYQLSEELIKNAGFSDINKVRIYGYGGTIQPESLDDEYLRETDDLPEVPTCTVNGKRLFYAKGPISWTSNNTRERNPYSNYGYYFLTEGAETPLTITEEDFIASYYPSAEDYNALYEVDDFAWFEGGRNLFDATLFTSGTSKSYTIEASGKEGNGSLQIALTADASTKATISLNDSILGTMSISSPASYNMAASSTKTYTVYNVKTINTVKIEEISGGNMRLDYIALHSNTPADAPNLGSKTFPSPEYVYHITNQNHHADKAVDMIIIIPTSQKILAQAQRLQQIHEQQDNMTVRIVPADELYNEFSSGTPDATAYRRYLKMFYDRAETDEEIPSYLLLFGDGLWDNRMLTSSCNGFDPDDFLICFESENSFSETDCYVSDDFFCMLDDEEVIQYNLTSNVLRYKGTPDIAVGRLPARTESEAKIYVDKIERYLSNEDVGAWQNVIVFMGDDGDSNIHMITADSVANVAQRLHPNYEIKKIMWDMYERQTSSTGNSYPDVTTLIKQYMSQGALIMNYSGHGATNQLSHEKVITTSDFKTISSEGLPLWMTASCDIMPYDGVTENIGEQAMLSKDGGAIAFFGTTRTVYSNYNERMNLQFTQNVLQTEQGIVTSIGEAVRLAKNALVDNNLDVTANKLQYTLLGDPAIRLAIPKHKVIVDSINGSEEKCNLRAGEEVMVCGHIEDANGNEINDFTGIITFKVYDAQQLMECRLNDSSEASTKFTFYDHPNTVCKGNDSISDGTFAFTFVVPKDISYSDKAGKLTIFAYSGDKMQTASGYNDEFSLNGSSDFGSDITGPSIYCYLNSTSFYNGETVNTTPYFIAEVSDDDGINVSGNSIGHDLQLTIDGRGDLSYVLNDYFSFDFGTYKSGTVEFSIPQLSAGQHTLRFQAWDILNNSSASELTFNVEEGLSPTIFDVTCSPNPARTQATFTITHDRIGSQIGVVLEIFDTSGRKLYMQSADLTPSSQTCSITWDLAKSNGARLSSGLYLYRIKLNCESGKYVSRSKKMMIAK